MKDEHMRSYTALLAALLGAATLTAITGAGAPQAETVLNLNGSLGDLSVDHTDEIAPGGLLGSNQIRLGKNLPPVYFGLIIDLAPFDSTCADGKISVHPATGPDRDLPLGESCGIPLPYLVLGDTPAAAMPTICSTLMIGGNESARSCTHHE
ncbi:hypothetical protein [Nocardia sp. NBC_01327]|uniref:hypothetical protein n=1 Tax=Nocardia sp. NBC_01327 TaxID=2903593 RepID=UPI002E144797|nr:hypothetical protein OG326_29285 [Nocardia sp. NBC_01327]